MYAILLGKLDRVGEETENEAAITSNGDKTEISESSKGSFL